MNKTILAKIISLVFDPVVTLSVIIPFLVLSSDLNVDSKMFITLSMFIFFVVAPFQIIIFSLKKKWISNIEIEKRSQRIRIEFITLICWLCGLIFLLDKTDHLLLTSFIILFAVLAVAFVLNFFTKVSVHILTLTTSILFLSLKHPVFLLLFIAIPAVAWSRIYLKHHSLFQTILGALIPLVTVPLLWQLLL